MEMAVNRVANDAAKVTSLVDLFNGVPNRDLIRNLEVSMSAVQIGGRSFPVSHNDRGSATSIAPAPRISLMPLMKRAISCQCRCCDPR